jgi:hypothetical protein
VVAGGPWYVTSRVIVSHAADGTQLYICRKDLGKDKGLQPGWLGKGKCHIPYNYDDINSPPFQALYNVFGPNGQPSSPGQSPAGVQDQGPLAHGILITFGSGSGATAGMVTVTNGATGTTASKPLPPNSSAQQCMEILQQAALQAGLQIQIQRDGNGLKVFGAGNAINVTQASTTLRASSESQLFGHRLGMRRFADSRGGRWSRIGLNSTRSRANEK